MKITSLQVDGFGVWSKLKLEGLGEDLNVLYGPNEAGKTTLLQFVRSVLYGYAAERQKYLPPLHGGKAGGSLELATPNGQFQLDRHYEDNDEQITLSAADGTRQGEHLVKVLLSEVDESIFNNVFAVGLSEIQELGTLGGTEAAELLYNLTAGMDRISLVEVMRELENSRNSILDREGGPCRMTQLIERREKLRGEIEELGKLTRRYGRLAAEDKQLKREIARLEEEHAQAEHQSRVVELAVSLRERWQQRDELDEQLAALGPGRELPVGAIDRFDELNERIENHASRIKQRDAQQKQIKRDAAGLRINKPLWRQAARIEALSEQQAWLAGLQTQVADLEKENAQRQTELDNELKQLGIGGDGKSGPTPSLSRRRMPALRTPARAMKECRRRLQEAERAAAQSAEEAQSLSRQVETAIAGKGSGDLSTLMEKAADRAASFRRRLQIDERLDQLLRYRKEQEQRGEELLDKQMLPGWVLAAFGVVFALGFMLVIVGMFMPASFTGSLGWALAGLGVVGCGGAVAGKMMMERSNDRQLMACEKQLDMLEMQIEEAERERDALDAKLPGGGGPIASRLEAAEGELAALEELVPVDARRSSAAQDAQATAARVEDARRDLSAARHGWREALRSSGLPENFTPSQVKQVLSRNDHVDQLRQHLARNSEELEHRRGELDSLLGRITQLAAETGMESAGSPPLVQLRLLCEAVAEQESRVKQRRQLKQRLRKVRHNRAKHEEALGRLKSRRRELLRECDVEDEQTLRHRAAQFAKTEVLRRQRETLSKEIETAVGGHCPQQAIAEQLAGDAADKLETRWEQLAERSQSFQKELGQRFQRRGQLAEQLKNLADDRRMAGKQLEMAMLEKRIKETAQRWQTLAVTSLTLEKIREIYEQQRQPETLKEASQYLDALTRGRYCRVWTPLGEDVLRVDDAEGNVLAVEVLSRGTREQLFLSLRLALAASYERRGATLPLVLDDVLVNFDADRAKAAAAVLRDFAAAGHQLLVFTCHEHIMKLFQSLKVPVNRLPDNSDSAGATLTFSKAKKSRKSRKKATPVETVAAEPIDVEPVVVEEEVEVIALEEEPEEEQTDEAVFEVVEADPPWDEEDDESDEEEVDEDESDELDDEDEEDEDDYEEGESDEAEEYDEEEDEYEEDEEEPEDDDYEEDEYEEEEYDDEAEAA